MDNPDYTVRIVERTAGHGASELVVEVGGPFYPEHRDKAEELADFLRSAISFYEEMGP